MVKRAHDSVDGESVIEKLRSVFLQLHPDQLVVLLADFANAATLSTADFRDTRLDLPSFYTGKWSQLSAELKLPCTPSLVHLAPFRTPTYRLPVSWQKMMIKHFWKWQDVSRETLACLEPYIKSIVALFQGRVFDKPELAQVKTKYATGAGVEHEIFMMSGVVFIVVEWRSSRSQDANLAHLFLELLSAAEANKRLKYGGLRIYGLLTDFTHFSFYSYNPSTAEFCFDKTILVDYMRIAQLSDMINVSNKIFGLLLSAYIDGLCAAIKWCRDQPKHSKAHKLVSQYQHALELAERCVREFKRPVTNPEQIEEQPNRAMRWLTKSVCSIPRASSFSGQYDDPSTPAALDALAGEIIRKKYRLSETSHRPKKRKCHM